MTYEQFDIVLVLLDPTKGHEIKKTRPCVVISPDEMNEFLGTVIIVPMTTSGKLYPTRLPIVFGEKDGFLVLDQMRTIDKQRIHKKLGRLDLKNAQLLCERLQDMFSYSESEQ